MKARVIPAAFCAAALLMGCGGSSATLPPARSVTGPALAVRPALQPRTTATLRVIITVPKPRPRAMDPRYMSRSTKGISFSFSGASKFGSSFSVTPGSKGCTTKGVVTKCIFNLKLATGKYTGTVSAYDHAPAGGKIPKSARLLSTETNVPFTIASGKVNRAGFAFGGVVKSLSVSALPGGTIGTAFTSPERFSVTAQDADGNTIVGTYANPITLSDSDTSGATSVSAMLLSSKDTATLRYNGAGIVSAVISASAIGVTTASGLFAPAPSVTSMNVNSGLIGTQVSETLHGHFVAGTMSVNPVSGVTVKGVNSTASTVTATFEIDAEAATGTRNVTVSTGAAASVPQTFTISNTGVVVVTKNTDTNPGTPPGTGAGASGDLRYAMLNAHAGDSIVFDPAQMCGAISCTVTLAGPLPQIAQNLTIDGGWFTSGSPRVTIDGANTYRAFWATSGTVTIADLQIQNAKAKGGAAGAVPSCEGVGGGGAGLGAAIFIDDANVSVVNDYFLNDSVVGGNGASLPGGACSQGSSGGGGLGGDGGAYVGGTYGGGGGGGVLGPGGASSASSGGTGGPGFTTVGGTGGTSSSIAGGAGGYGAGGGGAGYSATGGSGGAGGFGGGGGGAAGNSGTAGGGGAGGFGGGGGGSLAGSCGNGGPGGGGAGCVNRSGSGGSLAASVGGGGGSTLGSGGGAAAGPAIFVTTGTLTTVNSGASGSSAAGGAAGYLAVAGGADPTPVFNYGGTVNGVSVTAGNGGPVASALGSSPPQLGRRSHGRDRPRRP